MQFVRLSKKALESTGDLVLSGVFSVLVPGGNRIVYDYNRLNQLAEKIYHNTGELENDRPVRMGYNGLGQRISMEDITGESAYAYDSLGRLKTAINGSGKVVEYVYDEGGEARRKHQHFKGKGVV